MTDRRYNTGKGTIILGNREASGRHCQKLFLTGGVMKNLSGQWKLPIPSYTFESKRLLRLLKKCILQKLGFRSRQERQRLKSKLTPDH